MDDPTDQPPYPVCIDPWWGMHIPHLDNPIIEAIRAHEAARDAGADQETMDRLRVEVERLEAARWAAVEAVEKEEASRERAPASAEGRQLR
ncbi:hypothetical protein ACFQX4_26715 [Roseomonas sp. GCM10028921]